MVIAPHDKFSVLTNVTSLFKDIDEINSSPSFFFCFNCSFTRPVFYQYLTVLLFPCSTLPRGFLPLRIISSEDWWIRRWYTSLLSAVYSSRTRKAQLSFLSFLVPYKCAIVFYSPSLFIPCPDMSI